MVYTINYTPRKSASDYNGPLSYNDCKTSEYMHETDTPYFCGEISELTQISNMSRFPRLGRGTEIHIKNTNNSNVIKFVYTGMDRTNSGEDVAGWRFKAISGNKFPVDLLIIND